MEKEWKNTGTINIWKRQEHSHLRVNTCERQCKFFLSSQYLFQVISLSPTLEEWKKNQDFLLNLTFVSFSYMYNVYVFLVPNTTETSHKVNHKMNTKSERDNSEKMYFLFTNFGVENHFVILFPAFSLFFSLSLEILWTSDVKLI